MEVKIRTIKCDATYVFPIHHARNSSIIVSFRGIK
jgi:hypothetical protein